MSTIPDYRQLKREIPQAPDRIDTRGSGENIGQGLLAVASVTSDIYKNKIDKQTSDADAEMYTHLVGAANSFDEDDDYSTMRQRFDADTTGKLGEVASKITDPNQRNEFVNKYKKEIASRGEQVSSQAWDKEADTERAGLFDRLNNIRDASLRDKNPDALAKANELFSRAIDSARKLNYIDETAGAKLHKQMQDDTAISYVDMLPLENRLGALKQLKDKLPPDKLAEMKKGIEKELIIGQAQTQVDEYINSDMKRSDVMKDADKKFSAKPELRKEVETRYDYAKNKQDKAIEEDQDELFNKYFLPVRAGESTVDSIPRADLERMSPAQQNSLFSAQSTSVSKTKVGFNISAEDNLNGLLRTKNFVELRKYYRENAGSMSDSQNKAWSKISIDGVIPGDIKSLFTATASIDAKTPGYTKERRGKLKEAMNDWFQSYQETNGQVPTDDLVGKQADRLIMEHDTSWYWGGTKPVFEMSEEEKQSMMSEAQDEDKSSFDDVSEYFKNRGIQPDHAQFMEAYKLLRDQRNAK